MNKYAHPILLIDDCQAGIGKHSPLHDCPDPWLIYKINYTFNTKTVFDAISLTQPKLICYDFDYPHSHGLKQIRQVKEIFPTMPLMLFTHIHSEELALWALRTRIWDIQIKPIDHQQFFLQAGKLVHDDNTSTLSVYNELPFFQSHETQKEDSDKVARYKTHAAIDFISTNYSKNISLKEVAKLCHMSIRTFSKQFKIEHGASFKDFLIRYRIDIAQNLIDSGTQDSITNIAMKVGFNDHSYFSRTFRHHIGDTPSQYRNKSAIKENA